MDLIIFILLSINFTVLLIVIGTVDDGVNLSFVNPIVIYNNIKVNWFGAWVLAIILNIVLPISSIPYWIYKLCTVGRKR